MTDYIRIIMEEGSVSDAARRLNISQPALSAKVRKIEEEYHIEIFRKNRRPLTLTEEGKAYLAYRQRQESLALEFRQQLSEMSRLKTGSLKVGGTSLYTTSFIPEAVSAFLEEYPGIEVSVVNGSTQHLAEMASKRQLDVYISSPGKKAAGIVYEPVLDTRMLVCVPSSYEINTKLSACRIEEAELCEAGAAEADFASFNGLPCIMLREDQVMGVTLAQLYRNSGIKPSRVIRTDQAESAYALTLAQSGISLMYDQVLAHMPSVPSDRVCCYAVRGPEMMTGQLYLAYPDDGAPSAAVKEFIRIFRRIFL